MLEVVMAVLSRVLVPLFILGMAGSTLVVVITFAHDLIDFFWKDESSAAPAESK